MSDFYILGLNGSHNGGITVAKNGKVVLALEFERLFNEKNVGLAQYKTIKATDVLFMMKYVSKYILNYFGIEKFNKVVAINTGVNFGELYDHKVFAIEDYIPADTYIEGHHHAAHAYNVLYTSPYDKALIVSFDGGGNDGFFNVYLGDKKNKISEQYGNIDLLETVTHPTAGSPHLFLDLGLPYASFGEVLQDIRREGDLSNGILIYPGKIMGLASYGKVRKRWLNRFIKYYTDDLHQANSYRVHMKKLFDDLKIEHNDRLFTEHRFEEDRLSGKIAYDIAATSQKAFEEAFLIYAKPWMERYKDLPLCLAGGCALNIILNTRLKEEFGREVFVGPTPNDCGISTGLCLQELKPENPADITYAGLPILDSNSIFEHINDHWWFTSHDVDEDDIVDSLVKGEIIGLIKDNSEHGPRALGNRSILCNPSIKKMKDILNEKVKNREFYRPFAPVVRLEDVSEYFEFEGESRWMTFCPKVKTEWRKKLAAITHVDGTARIQTVTREQNTFLYDLITKFKEKTGVGVLLNTSYNVAGKPITNTVKDAMTLFRDTKLDKLIINDIYFKKCKTT